MPLRLENEGLTIRWLGQSGFLLEQEGRRLLLDPYLSDSLSIKYAQTDKPHVRMKPIVVPPGCLSGIDVVTSSHNHTDHLDAETLLELLRSNPAMKMVCPRANVAFAANRIGSTVDRWTGINDGESVEIGPWRIDAVAAAHNQIDRDEQGGCKYLGYIIRIGKFSVYHSGDTLRYDGMAELLAPFAVDVALLPINGDVAARRVSGNLDGRQAAQLAHDIGARLVVPCHYDLFEFNTADPAELFVPECEKLGQAFRVMELGETIAID